MGHLWLMCEFTLAWDQGLLTENRGKIAEGERKMFVSI